MVKFYSILLSIFFTVATISAAPEATPLTYKLYPNPMSGDSLQVTFDVTYKAGTNYKFTISNVIGQAVFTYIPTELEIKSGQFTIILEDIKLDKGIYLTKFSTGEQSSMQKLVVR